MRCVVVALWLLAPLTSAAADPITVTQTLTFDGLATSTFLAVPESYGGLTWGNMLLVNPAQHESQALAQSGYVTGTVSGDSVAFNNAGEPASVMGSTAFTFQSAYFTAAWNTDLTLNITAYSGDAANFAASLNLNPSAPLFFAPNWSGIYRLSFVSSGGQDAGLGGQGPHFALDNFMFASTPIPEPSTLVLLGTSLLAALAVRGRRRPR